MRKVRKIFCAALLTSLLFIPSWPAGDAAASNLVSQTWLPGDTLFGDIGFTVGLPVFGPGYNAALPRVNAQAHPNLTVTMKEIEQQVLPLPYPKTRVWAYETSDTKKGTPLGPANWPAVTLEAKRHVPTTITFVNDLPSFNPLEPTGAGLVQGLVTADKTIHWADPLNAPAMNYCVDNPTGPGCSLPFIGAPPAVVHLHGAETFSGFDGGPDQWFAPNGARGAGFYSLGYPGPGEAIYRYINKQEPGTLWFHDHALGATRTNVYSGMAAFYFLRSPGAEPKNLPTGAYEIEMAIQDRQFDTNAQLFWPDGSGAACGSGAPDDPCLNGPPPNPDIHPFWIPEFIGDVVVVNGAPWPVLNVEPRRYLFRLLDGSNARFYRLTFGNAGSGEPTPPVYAIGSDDGYIDAPVPVSQVFIAPGERSYVVVDFTGLAGETVTVMNDAPVPYPMGLVPGTDANQLSMDKIMRFNVSVPLVGTDKSCDPANDGCKRPTKMVRLTDGAGTVSESVTINKRRQLILKEWEGAGGPHEVFVNNTSYEGDKSANIARLFGDGISELPQQGSTELWEIINLTVDAHPMHVHLAQFQILNRQAYDTTPVTGYYDAAWAPAFGTAGQADLPAGCSAGQFCPGYGPPLAYNVANADGALGGNPAITPYLVGDPSPPAAWESGWKDTAKSLPGEVLRLLVRFTPTSVPVKSAKAGRNHYSFDPTQGPGYVWHCHIIDHEDNEMMRPYRLTK